MTHESIMETISVRDVELTNAELASIEALLKNVCAAEWNESRHPRNPAGSKSGGEFTAVSKGMVEEAKKFAEEKYRGIIHGISAPRPMMVHIDAVVGQLTDPTQKIVAYLHDSMEDASVTVTELRAKFGDHVADSVNVLTWHEKAGPGYSSESYRSYIMRVAQSGNKDAIAVKLADLHDNMVVRNPSKPPTRLDDYKWAEDALQNPNIQAGRFDNTVINPKAVDTMQAYIRLDGKWSDERVKAVHEPALAKMQAGVSKPADGVPRVFMTGGGWGSGKSTLLDKFPEQVGFPGKSGAIRSDPDALKNELPEYKRLAIGDNAWRNAPSFVHEESSELAKTAVAQGLRNGYSVIYDTSGDTGYAKLSSKVQGMRANGAKSVEGHYAFAGSIEEAQRRADARAANSKGTRRFMDPEALKANHRDVAKTWFAAAEHGTFDKLTLWSTAGKFGAPPTLIATAVGGNIQIHEHGLFHEFDTISKL